MTGDIAHSLSEIQAAYLAGLIDGEGSIAVSRKRDCSGVRRGYSYRLNLSISNTDTDLVQWCLKVTGVGTIGRCCSTNPLRHKAATRWTVWTRQAAQVLEQVVPHLVSKRQHAELALEFQYRASNVASRVGRFGLSDAEWQWQVDTHARMARLNRRGV